MSRRPTRHRPRPSIVLNQAFYRRLDQATASMTIAEVGKLTRTPPETARRMLVGIGKVPFEFAARLARATGVSLDWRSFARGRGEGEAATFVSDILEKWLVSGA